MRCTVQHPPQVKGFGACLRSSAVCMVGLSMRLRWDAHPPDMLRMIGNQARNLWSRASLPLECSLSFGWQTAFSPLLIPAGHPQRTLCIFTEPSRNSSRRLSPPQHQPYRILPCGEYDDTPIPKHDDDLHPSYRILYVGRGIGGTSDDDVLVDGGEGPDDGQSGEKSWGFGTSKSVLIESHTPYRTI